MDKMLSPVHRSYSLINYIQTDCKIQLLLKNKDLELYNKTILKSINLHNSASNILEKAKTFTWATFIIVDIL